MSLTGQICIFDFTDYMVQTTYSKIKMPQQLYLELKTQTEDGHYVTNNLTLANKLDIQEIIWR